MYRSLLGRVVVAAYSEAVNGANRELRWMSARNRVHGRPFSNGSFEISGNLSKDGKVEVGQKAFVSHVFPQDHVNTFAGLCGDDNPLHVNPEVAQHSMFKGTIVHGIFVSSLFSTLLGKSWPGAVYVSQTLSFKKPVHVGAMVTASIEVLSVAETRKGTLLTMRTVVALQDGSTAVEGEGKVLRLSDAYLK